MNRWGVTEIENGLESTKIYYKGEGATLGNVLCHKKEELNI